MLVFLKGNCFIRDANYKMRLLIIGFVLTEKIFLTRFKRKIKNLNIDLGISAPKRES